MFLVIAKIAGLNVFEPRVTVYNLVPRPVSGIQSEEGRVGSEQKDREEHDGMEGAIVY